MTHIPSRAFATVLSFSAALLLAGTAQAGVLTYEISVDTAGLSGSSGYLDFQFNPGNTSYDSGSATITNFATDGGLTTGLPALSNLGDVTGALPGPVTINNTDATNEYTPAFTYGSFFDVFVTLDVPVVSGTATGGSVFSLDVEDASNNPLLGSFPALEINLDATTGAPMITNDSGGAINVAETPEPTTLALSGMILAGLVVARRLLARPRAARVA